jgi:2-keto-4-pentenoate hydratase/2-oxohepta-3-ene-1,7-dioic acid hydratase in catechol pathway
MKIVRYLDKGIPSYGVIEKEIIKEIKGTPFNKIIFTDSIYQLSDVKLVAPSTPSKILGMALNYKSHILETRKPPTKPEPFFKTPSCIIGPSEPIILPRGVGLVQEEGELVVVIGRRCSKVSKAEAMDYVLGYTCGNDVSARKWQRGDIQWWRAKSADTFGPIGPCIVTDIDCSRLNIRVRINGKEVQHCNTSELLFDVPTLISFISQTVTLKPDDLIFTGTSGRPAQIKNGDAVEVEIDGIGILSNLVEEEKK